MKDMLENGKPASEQVVTHIDRCLSCLSCMTTCPSGVHYMHLVDHARAHIEETYQRPWHDRLMRSLLSAILPYPGRFRLALFGAYLGKPFKGVAKALPKVGPRMGAMLDLAPGRLPTRSAQEGPGEFTAQGEERGRVAILQGCAQTVLDPGINEATIRLLNRHGVTVTQVAGEGCCGALGAPYGAYARQSRFRPPQYRRLDPRGRGERPRRHHHHGIGLRHHDQGLRPHVPRGCGLCREGGPGLGAGKRHHRISRNPDAGTDGRGGQAHRRLSFRLLDAARPADSRGAEEAF